jgi:hypothetical protein
MSLGWISSQTSPEQETQEWLPSRGVLIYIIPQGRITPHIAARLATYFKILASKRELQG